MEKQIEKINEAANNWNRTKDTYYKKHKPRKRPGRHKKSPNKHEKRMGKYKR